LILEAATVTMMVLADSGTANPIDALNPISIIIKVSDKVTHHITEKHRPKPHEILTPERIRKFQQWEKEDWLKDDPHRDMWDPNWIKKD
jgi:hypothetical protein